MIVKLIRQDTKRFPVTTMVFEPKQFQFSTPEQVDADYKENLELFYLDGSSESIELYAGDEVWLTNNTGKTADRWMI